MPNNRSKLGVFTVDSKTICWKSAKNSIFDYVINYAMTKSSKSKKFIRKCSIFRILFLNLALALKINRFHVRLLNCPKIVIKTLMVKNGYRNRCVTSRVDLIPRKSSRSWKKSSRWRKLQALDQSASVSRHLRQIQFIL